MKKALLVGINRYQTPGNNLNGCINDIISIKNLLISRFNYNDSDIKIIQDEHATKTAIVAGLTDLLGSKADHLVFHYSGHGTQFFDPVCNQNKDAICPTDAKDLATLITDHELAKIFNSTPAGCKLAFIADCCHSGTVDRNFSLSERPEHQKMMHIASLARPNMSIPPSKNMAAVPGCHVLLSGCRDDQTSADSWFSGVPHGALTFSIMEVLKSNCKQTWSQLHLAAAAWLAKNNFSQVPQLSGPDDIISSLVFQ